MGKSDILAELSKARAVRVYSEVAEEHLQLAVESALAGGYASSATGSQTFAVPDEVLAAGAADAWLVNLQAELATDDAGATGLTVHSRAEGKVCVCWGDAHAEAVEEAADPVAEEEAPAEESASVE